MSEVRDDIVIVGAGLATSLGPDLATTWEGVKAGRCGVGPAPALEQPGSRGAGQVPDLPEGWMPDAPREVRYLRHVLDAVLSHSGLRGGEPDPSRTGIVLGTTLHGMRAAGRFFRTGDYGDLSGFVAAAVIARATEGLATRAFAATTCAACASGLSSIALAATLLRARKLDRVIAGGYDPISEYAYAGFNSLRLIAAGPQRPFARDRQGMKVAEGYGVVVLEREEDARRRGATVFARVLSCAASADAHHLSQPHPEGIGAASAMNQALSDAGLSAGDIGMVAAHATATPDNDGAEYRALRGVFGERLPEVPVTAFKSHLGHSLGAAGAVELILTAQAMREGLVPPVANVRAGDVDFAGLRLVTGQPERREIRRAMVVSLGFGGSNACVVLENEEHPKGSGFRVQGSGPRSPKALITGIGVVLPHAIGNEAFVAMLNDPGHAPLREDTGAVEEEPLVALLNARRVRRMSEYVKLSLAATALAVRDAGLGNPPLFPDRCGAFTATAHGSAAISAEYYRQIVDQGIDAGNPLLFAEGVPNAGSAHLGMMLGFRGSAQAVIGSRTTGLDALSLAAARIETGEWDLAIVNGADEYSALVNAAYRRCGQGEGLFTGGGSVTLLLESPRAAAARGARVYGSITATTQTSWRAGDEAGAVDAIAAMLGSLGPADAVVGSANGTRLDRVEAMAVRRACGRGARTASLHGHIAECFAATPLAALAAVLLTGRLPRLWDGGDGPDAGLGTGYTFNLLCSDYQGVTSGVRICSGPQGT